LELYQSWAPCSVGKPTFCADGLTSPEHVGDQNMSTRDAFKPRVSDSPYVDHWGLVNISIKRMSQKLAASHYAPIEIP